MPWYNLAVPGQKLMTTPATAAGSTPATPNLLARFIGIITSPRATFQAVAASPKVLGMLLTVSLLTAVFSALPMTTDAGKQAALDQQVQSMQSMGFQVTDEMYDQMQKGTGRMPYMTGISVLIFIPIVSLVFAGILFAVFNAALGGEASFKQVFSVYIHSGVIGAVSAVLSGTVNYFSGRVTSVANLGALLPMLPEKSFVANLLGTVDVFILWSVIVTAIGLGVLYKRRTQPIAISFLAIYAVIALVIALFKSRGGA
jgi:membrane protein, antimicrobial resistance system